MSRDDAIFAAKEAVRLVGFGLGNLMYRIYQGDVRKADWTDEDRDTVRGTHIFLLGGAIGTLGYTSQLLPLIARRQFAHLAPAIEPQLQIFTPAMESAHAGAFGAYFLSLPESAKEEIRGHAGVIHAQNKIPIIPLLDIGGTKVSLVLAYIDAKGSLTLDILQAYRFSTPVSEPDTFYTRLASLLAAPLLGVKSDDLFQLIPVLAVGQPGRFRHPKGEIGLNTAKDLGPGFPGTVPSNLLAEKLSVHGLNLDIYCANDGRCQFVGIGAVSKKKEPEKWWDLGRAKVAFLGLGTGLGAGFGQIDEHGDVQPFSMHNAFDISADAEHEILPPTPFLAESLKKKHYIYGDLLSGKFFRQFMQKVDLSRLKQRQDLVFVPLSSARDLSPDQLERMLAVDNRLSPLNAILINEMLADETVTARTEEMVDSREASVREQLIQALETIADELDRSLLKRVRECDYEQVIEEVARAKRRGRRVQFLGIGKSHSIGRDLAYIYNNLGIDSASCELTGANSENLTNLREDDLVFLISNSGRAAELLQLIPYIHRKRCLTVAVTGDKKSPLALQCIYLIDSHVTRNPSPIAEAPTTSTTSALAAGTAIGMVVSYLFDYDAEDFFLDHPNLQFTVDFPMPGVKADASFDKLAKVEDIFHRFANSIRELTKEAEFVPQMLALTKRILVSHFNRRTIFFTGAGASLRVAEKVADTLTSIGIDASAVNSARLPHGDFAHVRRGDLLVIISFSGETRQLLRIREIASQKGVDCAAVTSEPESQLARSCHGLCVVAGKGANDKDLVPLPDQKILSSFINLTVGDALAVILAQLLGTTSREFAAEAHQGGAFARTHARINAELLGHLSMDLVESVSANPEELARLNEGLLVQVTKEHLLAYERRRLVPQERSPEVMIFGMGGIGLAYLAPLLNLSQKAVIFVEKDQNRINEMRRIGYRIRITDGCVSKEMRHVGRLSVVSAEDASAVTAYSLRVDTILTAVGVANIQSLLPIFANIIRLRYQFWLEEPLNFVLCENFAVEDDPLAHLRHRLREMLAEAEIQVYFDGFIGLVPAIDEAVVPEVSVESLGQPIVVEKESAALYIDRREWRSPGLGNEKSWTPELGERFVFTDSFLPLHMRKLWVHNMGHALIGYLGFHAGYELMYEAVMDARIEEITRRAMRTICSELYRRWSYHDTHHTIPDGYIDWRWARYQNAALGDRISRVCRDPERKLRGDDRLLGPVNYIRKYAAPGPETDGAIVDILVGVVAAMHYSAKANVSSPYANLRVKVLSDLINVDSALLQQAETWFAEFCAQYGHLHTTA